MPATLCASSAGLRAFRSVLRPDGSPMEPVAPPICRQLMWTSEELTRASAWCPRARKCSNPSRGRRLPTCRLDAEGSTPTYTQLGDSRWVRSAGLRRCELEPGEGDSSRRNGLDEAARFELIDHVPRWGCWRRRRGPPPCCKMAHAVHGVMGVIDFCWSAEVEVR